MPPPCYKWRCRSPSLFSPIGQIPIRRDLRHAKTISADVQIVSVRLEVNLMKSSIQTFALRFAVPLYDWVQPTHNATHRLANPTWDCRTVLF